MPANLDRCVQDLMKQGKSREEAFAICQASLNKKDDPFAKGKKEVPKIVPKKKVVVPKKKK